MSKLDLVRIEPSDSNARLMQHIIFQDFARLDSMTTEQARSIASPGTESNDVLVTTQHEQLVLENDKYYMVDGIRSWLGVVKLADWLTDHEAPFVSYLEREKMKIMRRLGIISPNLDESVMGIHVFARSNEAVDKLPDITYDMLDAVATEARKRGRTILKCAVDNEDVELQQAFDEIGRPISTETLEPRVAEMKLGDTKREYRLREVTIE